MNKSRCPHCGVQLGNFRYADACQSCRVELKHNTTPLVPAKKHDSQNENAWPIRFFFRIMRFVES